MHGTEFSSDVNFVLIFKALSKRSPYYEIDKILININEIINSIEALLLFSDKIIFWFYKNKTKKIFDYFFDDI